MTVILPSRIPRERRDIKQVNFDGKKRGYEVWAMVSIAITKLAYYFILFSPCHSRAKSFLPRQLTDRPLPFTEGEMDWQLRSGMMMFGT